MGSIEKKKIWTAIVMVPPTIFLVVLSPLPIFTLMVLGVTFLGLREFYTLTLPRSRWIERWIGIGLGLILSMFSSLGNASLILLLFILLLLSLSILFMITSQDLSSTTSHIGIVFLGIFTIGFLLSHFSLIRNRSDGKEWIIFLVITVWAGDIFAFLIGSLIGKHKLYPKISPKKTFEGFLGGMIGSMIVALAFALLFMPKLSIGYCIFLAFGIGLFGQIGDFVESMWKRSAQVKDSGALIPGHGGMLDRLDSFLFSTPFLHYSILYLLKGVP